MTPRIGDAVLFGTLGSPQFGVVLLHGRGDSLILFQSGVLVRAPDQFVVPAAERALKLEAKE